MKIENTNEIAKENQVHVWEALGYVAPFRCVGIAEMPSKALANANPEAYQHALSLLPRGVPCGTCDVCGTAITVNYIIRDAEKNYFVVGSSCVAKTGDRGIVDKVKKLKNKRNREKARVRREGQRLAKLEAQRQRNGGLTDCEAREKSDEERSEERDRRMKPVLDLLYDNILDLSNAYGNFAESVTNDLRRGKIPTGRGLDIACEIVAKNDGRKGSDAYKKTYATALEQFEKAGEMIDEIDTWYYSWK